ncbi:MAG: hypothetical protein HONBIEJF_00005 [Fimbriimonadaceae bacterium]|nr:hypothetical protein [Fimbriimonadaceae bacterium]
MAATTVELVETRGQWERAVALRNMASPESPTTVERAMNFAAAIPDRVPRRRFLLSLNGKELAYVSVLQAYWFDDHELFDFDFYYGEEDTAAGSAVEFAEQTILELGGKRASCWYRSDRERSRDALVSRGYVEGQRNPVGMIHLSTFDPASWASHVSRIQRHADYSILTIAEYAERHPKTWRHEYWRLEMDLLADVPLPEPWKDIPFEDWEREIDANEQRWEWMFFALHGDQIVGLTQLIPNQVDQSIMNTGLTGVRREHRRNGLATALKANAFTLAKEFGAERIYMDNEVNNPMYQLNLALGVRPIFEYVNTRKTL